MARLRWNLCKTFKVPVNDKMFEQINSVQWVWYQMQLALDEKNKFELFRDVAEHNAMFTNPEGVQQVRDARDNSFKTEDGDFKDLLAKEFGRDGPNFDNTKTLTKEDIRKQNNLSSYLDMDLDQVSFIPYDES